VRHDQGSGVPPADPRGAAAPPRPACCPLRADDSTTATDSPRHDAGGGGPSNFAVLRCRSGRSPIVSMVRRFPSTLRS